MVHLSDAQPAIIAGVSEKVRTGKVMKNGRIESGNYGSNEQGAG